MVVGERPPVFTSATIGDATVLQGDIRDTRGHPGGTADHLAACHNDMQWRNGTPHHFRQQRTEDEMVLCADEHDVNVGSH
jgi:hypothetical protein